MVSAKGIISLNNDAARLLAQAGRFIEATHLLKQAAHHLTKETACPPTASVALHSQKTTIDVVQSSSCTLLFPLPIDETVVANDAVVSPGNLFPVYNQAFGLSVNKSHAWTADDSEEQRTTISAVVIYNLALANHRIGLSSTGNSGSSLKNALRLYGQALTLLQSNIDLVAERQALFVLTLATICNMGQIKAHFWDLADAQLCFDRLEMLLMDAPCSFDLPESEAEFFYSIVCHDCGCFVNAAAAA